MSTTGTNAAKKRRPLRIGLSACFLHRDDTRPIFKGKTLLYAEESMLRWLADAGAVPVLVPRATAALPMRDIVRDLDAVILQGGSDLSPTHYGEEPARPEWAGDAIRDVYEMELFRVCLEEDRPVLGVCRGLQLINVALGGSLFQDIATFHPGNRIHRDGQRYDRLGHEVAIQPGSLLARWCGMDGRGSAIVRVNTVHHQGIKNLGRDLVAEAHSVPDGVVEAIRYAPAAASTERVPFAYGVQWHPEFMRDVLPEETSGVSLDDAREKYDPKTASTPLFDPDLVLRAFLSEVQRRRESRSLDL